MSLEDVFTFGKYKGLTLEWAINEDLKYVKWLVEEKMLEMNNEAFAEYQENLKFDETI